jgi:hypothetical protein
VFIGAARIVSAEPMKVDAFTRQRPVIVFDAIETHGVSGPSIVVRGTGSDCDFPFEQGASYIV